LSDLRKFGAVLRRPPTRTTEPHTDLTGAPARRYRPGFGKLRRKSRQADARPDVAVCPDSTQPRRTI